MPGPVPRRSTQRRRRNRDSRPEIVEVPRAPDAEGPPPASPEWHPIAVTWYESLSKSGQAVFYEPSDWATAQYVAEAMSRNLTSARGLSGQLFAAVMSAMTELLTTEGARRRARVELEKAVDVAEPASVAIMAKYRKAAGQD